MTTNIFTDTSLTQDVDTTTNYRSELVGDGKKYANDDEALKALWHSQQRIKQYEQEQAELRNELNTRMSIEEFLDKQTQRTTTTPTIVAPTGVTEQRTETGINPQDIRKLVDDAYSKKQEETQRATNAAKSIQMMKEVWGNSAKEKLQEVRQNLGLGEAFLQEIAERSPEAFIQTIGAKSTSTRAENISPPVGRQVSSNIHMNTQEVRNEQYWDNMHKTNPTYYFSAEGMNAKHKDAMSLGVSFFNN